MKVLLFGGTGSAGGSVLRACLADVGVEQVRSISRRSTALSNPKLTEIVHGDYLHYEPVSEAFNGVDVCCFCLGRSVRQVSGEVEYRRITHDFPLAVADMLHTASPDAVFHYLSGAGASLTSRFMWARVKAEAERDLMARVGAVCWRPASIDGMPSASEPLAYKLFRPIARALLRPFPSAYITGEDIGRAMLAATRRGMRHRIVENAEMRELAGQR